MLPLESLPDDIKEIISSFAIKKLRYQASQTIQNQWFKYICNSNSYELKCIIEDCMAINNGTIVTFRNMSEIFNLSLISDFEYIRKFNLISKIVFLYKHTVPDSFLYNEDDHYRNMVNKYNILSSTFFYKYFKWLEDKNIISSKKIQTEPYKQLDYKSIKYVFYDLVLFFIAYWLLISIFF